MGAPILLLRTRLAKMALNSVFATPIQEVCLGCGKNSRADLNFALRRTAGDASGRGQFMSVGSSGFRVQQQEGRWVAEWHTLRKVVKTQRRIKASKANRSLVTEATDESLKYDAPEASDDDDQFQPSGLVGEVENADDEMDEVLAEMSSIGATVKLPVPSNSVCVGIDPDLSGAIAVLKSQDNCTLAEVIDVPCITVAVNKKMRRRHDYQSIAAIVKQLQAPQGSIAYVEQAMPFPKDGKQVERAILKVDIPESHFFLRDSCASAFNNSVGLHSAKGWYITGYGYGIWLGILAAAGFTVIPIQARAWKTAMGICGKEFTKDDSRALASSMFPVLSTQLRRKRDHGRAEALLIAAFGKGMAVSKVAALDEPTSSNTIISPSQPASVTPFLATYEPPF